jgi:hypothetical protein
MVVLLDEDYPCARRAILAGSASIARRAPRELRHREMGILSTHQFIARASLARLRDAQL